MLVNDNTIEKLEKLSMLNIENKEEMKNKLEEIIVFMKNLSTNEKPDITEKEEEINYREDIKKEKYDLTDFLENNSKIMNNMFEVPKVL